MSRAQDNSSVLRQTRLGGSTWTWFKTWEIKTRHSSAYESKRTDANPRQARLGLKLRVYWWEILPQMTLTQTPHTSRLHEPQRFVENRVQYEDQVLWRAHEPIFNKPKTEKMTLLHTKLQTTELLDQKHVWKNPSDLCLDSPTCCATSCTFE